MKHKTSIIITPNILKTTTPCFSGGKFPLNSRLCSLPLSIIITTLDKVFFTYLTLVWTKFQFSLFILIYGPTTSHVISHLVRSSSGNSMNITLIGKHHKRMWLVPLWNHPMFSAHYVMSLFSNCSKILISYGKLQYYLLSKIYINPYETNS